MAVVDCGLSGAECLMRGHLPARNRDRIQRVPRFGVFQEDDFSEQAFSPK
ncbi:MAG: hypothetical protein GY866_04740 [Proteobacteria bacterium]|nr:hypothetical protein [Pseudomonadota bacterium]